MKYYLKINDQKVIENIGAYKNKKFAFTSNNFYYDRLWTGPFHIIQIPHVGGFIYLNNLGNDITCKVIETGKLCMIRDIPKCFYEKPSLWVWTGEIYTKENGKYVKSIL